MVKIKMPSHLGELKRELGETYVYVGAKSPSGWLNVKLIQPKVLKKFVGVK